MQQKDQAAEIEHYFSTRTERLINEDDASRFLIILRGKSQDQFQKRSAF
jgi:hypothetical protein